MQWPQGRSYHLSSLLFELHSFGRHEMDVELLRLHVATVVLFLPAPCDASVRDGSIRERQRMIRNILQRWSKAARRTLPNILTSAEEGLLRLDADAWASH
eukprot:8192749-Pyramimonas_sp.AAC.1